RPSYTAGQGCREVVGVPMRSGFLGADREKTEASMASLWPVHARLQPGGASGERKEARIVPLGSGQ
ncbi:MAG: hypothetical protein O6913_06595, partial [Chloroflexi bacterium]|nr:hypothetical protein [Chloroflexota bacterium]